MEDSQSDTNGRGEGKWIERLRVTDRWTDMVTGLGRQTDKQLYINGRREIHEVRG